MVCGTPLKRGPNKGNLARGTQAGYQRHWKAGEAPCNECLAAHNQSNAEKAPKYRDRKNDRARLYHQENKERRNKQTREWQKANPEKLAAASKRWCESKGRERYQQRYLDNRETYKERTQRWQKENPEANREKTRRYNSRKKSALTIPFTTEELEQRMSMFGNRCWLRILCDGAPREAVEHVIALDKGGPHCLSNLRPACIACNSSKLAKDWREYVSLD